MYNCSISPLTSEACPGFIHADIPGGNPFLTFSSENPRILTADFYVAAAAAVLLGFLVMHTEGTGWCHIHYI